MKYQVLIVSSPTNTVTVTCSQIEAPQISILIWCLETSLLPLVPHQSSRSVSLSLCVQEHIDIVSLIHKGNQLSIQQQHLSHILYLLLKFVQCRSSNVLPRLSMASKHPQQLHRRQLMLISSHRFEYYRMLLDFARRKKAA